MPDLTPMPYYHCETAEYWEQEVQGSRGDKYTVRWDRHHHKSPQYQYEYSCTCKGYEFRGPVHCKHIRQAAPGHCGWDQFTDGGEPDQDACPRCGKEVKVTMYAV